MLNKTIWITVVLFSVALEIRWCESPEESDVKVEVVADNIETPKQKRGDEEHHLPFGMEYNPELDDFPPHEPIMQPSEEEEEDGEQEIKNRPYENSNEKNERRNPSSNKRDEEFHLNEYNPIADGDVAGDTNGMGGPRFQLPDYPIDDSSDHEPIYQPEDQEGVVEDIVEGKLDDYVKSEDTTKKRKVEEVEEEEEDFYPPHEPIYQPADQELNEKIESHYSSNEGKDQNTKYVKMNEKSSDSSKKTSQNNMTPEEEVEEEEEDFPEHEPIYQPEDYESHDKLTHDEL